MLHSISQPPGYNTPERVFALTKKAIAHYFFVLIIVLIFTPTGVASPKKEAIITYLSWYMPYGYTTGCNKYGKGGMGYLGFDRYRNRPLASQPSAEVSPIEYAATNKGGDSISSELRVIKSAGFDVIAYDLLPDPTPKYSPTTGPAYCGLELLNIYGMRSHEVGLKLALFSDVKNVSSDYPHGYIFDSDSWENAYSEFLKHYGSTKWYWQPLGLPAIFQFGSTHGAIKDKVGRDALNETMRLVSNTNKRTGGEFTLFVDVRPGDPLPPPDKHIIPYTFAPGAPYKFINEFQSDILRKAPYKIWQINPGYYRRNIAIHLPPDFLRIHNGYVAAMSNNADAVMVNTWNDYQENTDIAPSADKGLALTTIFGYYNDWFKANRQPKIDHTIGIFAIPKYKFLQTVSHAPKWGAGDKEDEGNNQGSLIYYWIASNKLGELRVSGRSIKYEKGLTIGSVNIGPTLYGDISSVFSKPYHFKISQQASELSSTGGPGRDFAYHVIEEER